MGLFDWKGPILFGLYRAAAPGSLRARWLVRAKFREEGKIVRRALMLPLKASQVPFAARECDGAKAGVTNGGVLVLLGGTVHKGFWGFHSHSRHGKPLMAALKIRTLADSFWLAGKRKISFFL
jgi:hypothetical protein